MDKSLTYVEKMVSSLDLLSLESSAEELMRALRNDDPVSRARIHRCGLKTDDGIAESIVRDTIAIEHGFDHWKHATDALKIRELTSDQTERACIAACVSGNKRRIAEIIDQYAVLRESSSAIAFALALPRALEIISQIDVNHVFDPLGWSPLLYACCVDVHGEHANVKTRRIIVSSLLDAGADANSGHVEKNTLRGYLTALGGAIGYRRDPVLVKSLLDAGADINDGPTLYEGSAIWYAVMENDSMSMRHLLDAEPPLWHLCHALPHAIDLGHDELINQLLAAGADPNWDKCARGYGGNCLHETVMVRGSVELAERLLASNASLTQLDGGGRTPLAVAKALNRIDLLECFKKHGGADDQVSEVETWVQSCFAHDQETAEKLSDGLKPPREWTYEDHLWVCHAAREADVEALNLLLVGGMNPNAIDYDGNTALHRAVESCDPICCGTLVQAGADPEFLNYEGRSPFDLALVITKNREDVLAALGEIVRTRSSLCLSLNDADAFDAAAGSISIGDLDTLKQICDSRPYFAQARSSRPHKCTLLNYIGVNGFEGERQKTPENVLEIMDFLIDDLGCDARALSYTYRGGPGNTTIGLLTSSGHPRDVGLTLAMTHKLVKAGGEGGENWQLLIEMQDHRLDGTLRQFVDSLDPKSRVVEGALIEIASLSEYEFAQLLLDRGVDPNATLWGSVRAIHQAAINGDRKMVELLLEAEADPTLKDDQWDGDALGWAYAGGHEELGAWIRDWYIAKHGNS